MSKQTNFKKIFIILGILLALLLIVKLKDKQQGDRSFRAFVLEVDTAKVNTISIKPKEQIKPIVLTKSDAFWMMDLNGKKVEADENMANGLLGQVHALKTKSVAASSKDKWSDFEVSDSTGTLIQLKDGSKEVADFIVGKFSYTQPQGQNPYGGQQNIQMTSYIRLSDEEVVYAVDGYLSMMFNRDANSFRKSTVIDGDSKSWKKLVFTYPADSSFTLVNQNNKWMVNGALADSASTASYLAKIGRLSDANFDDNFVITEDVPAVYTVRVEGENQKNIEIKAYKNMQGDLVFVSSQNKGNIIRSESVAESLLVGKQTFLAP